MFVNELSHHATMRCSCPAKQISSKLCAAFKAFKAMAIADIKPRDPEFGAKQIKGLKAIEKTFQGLGVPQSHYFLLQLSHYLIGTQSSQILSLLQSDQVSEASQVYDELARYATTYIAALRCAGTVKLHPFISNTHFAQASACFLIWDFLANRRPRGKLLEDYSEKLADSLKPSFYNVSSTHGQQSLAYAQLSQFKMSLATFDSQK